MFYEKQPRPNTLEVPSAEGLPYEKFWAEFRDTENLVNLDDVKKTCQLGSYLTGLTTTVVRGAELTDIELLPDICTGEPQEVNIGNAIAEWDRSAGTFNKYQGGQSDLLRAAGLLLYNNFADDPESFNMTGSDSDQVYDQFVTLTDNNSWESQKGTADLLLAGQLIHKAAWLEPDPLCQEHLFTTAIAAYEQLYNDPEAKWSDRLQAGQFRADIRFQQLDQEIHEAGSNGDREALRDYQDIAFKLLSEQVADLQKTGELVDLANELGEVDGLEAFWWAGFMLEQFTVCVTRDLIYLRTKPDHANEYGVRRAFAHEDQPRTLKLKPKRSFDMVVQHRNTEGEIKDTTSIQFKLLGRTGEKRPGDRESDYESSHVKVIYIKRCSTDKMTKAAEALLASYEQKERLEGNGTVDRVQKLLNNIFDEEFLSSLV